MYVILFYFYFRTSINVEYFNLRFSKFFLGISAIAIYKPQDVRPILEAYSGKDIPLEYAKKEAEAKKLHIEEWEQKRKGLSSGGFTLSGLFGMSSDVRPQSRQQRCSIIDMTIVYRFSSLTPPRFH